MPGRQTEGLGMGVLWFSLGVVTRRLGSEEGKRGRFDRSGWWDVEKQRL